MTPEIFYEIKTIEENQGWIYKEEIRNLMSHIKNGDFEYSKFEEKGEIKLNVKLHHPVDDKYPITYSSVEYRGYPFAILTETGRYGEHCSLYVTNTIIFQSARKHFSLFFKEEEDNNGIEYVSSVARLDILDGYNNFITLKTEDGYELVENTNYILRKNPEDGYMKVFDEKLIKKLRQERLMPLYRHYDIVNTKIPLFQNEEICNTWADILKDGLVQDDDISNVVSCNKDGTYIVHEILPPEKYKCLLTFSVGNVNYEIQQKKSLSSNISDFVLDNIKIIKIDK